MFSLESEFLCTKVLAKTKANFFASGLDLSQDHLESINSARIYFSNQNIDWFEEVIRYTW
jgi:hypothetical protein